MNHNGHLTQDDLILFLDRELDQEAAARAEQHLLECGACARLLHTLKTGSHAYQQYRQQVLTPSLDVPQTGWARLSQERAKEKRHHWGLGWAVACACGLALSLAYWQWPKLPSAQEVLTRAEAAPDQATGSLLLVTGKDRLFRPAVLEPGHSEARFQHVRALFVQAHYSWENPLSARSFADWRRRLPRKEDALTAIREQSGKRFYRLQTSSNEGILKTASLTLQAETYHPTKADFAFVGEQAIQLSEQSEISKTEFQQPVKAAVKIVETPATPEDELRVFAALDAMGAEAEEPIDVKLDTEHHTVLVTGMGLATGRRKQIETAIAGLPHTVIRFSAGQRPNDDAINLPNPDVPDESAAFRQVLQDRYGGARQLQMATDKAIDATNGLFARAHLLLLLAREFPAPVEASLAPNSETNLLSLRQRHVGAMGYALRQLREDLSPLLETVEPEPISPGPWQSGAEDLFSATRNLDRQVSRLLSGRYSEQEGSNMLKQLSGEVSKVESLVRSQSTTESR